MMTRRGEARRRKRGLSHQPSASGVSPSIIQPDCVGAPPNLSTDQSPTAEGAERCPLGCAVETLPATMAAWFAVDARLTSHRSGRRPDINMGAVKINWAPTIFLSGSAIR